MRGRDVLWQPGTDHAGIATQMVVERLLPKENKTDRRNMGREAFLKRVWEWKEESGGTIVRQLRRLGASCDWAASASPWTRACRAAVVKVFVQLYKEGLIYKDKRLVNWDPKLQTAISDLEVGRREIKGQLWHIRYPIEGADAAFIMVATTRPETMLGDTGVAVHPDDERYKRSGRQDTRSCRWSAGCIPIIADDYADPEKGTGAVKITPAHDFNDFEVGKRHDLPHDQHPRPVRQDGAPRQCRFRRRDAEQSLPATLRAARPRPVRGAQADRRQCWKSAGLLEKVEPHVYQVPHGDRSGVVIEPWLTDQWYVDAADAGQAGDRGGRDGRHGLRPRRTGRRPISNGCATSSPGASRASSGGAIRFRPGTGPDGDDLRRGDARIWRSPLRPAHYGTRIDADAATRTCSTPGSPRRCGRSRRSAGRTQTPDLKRYYPTDVLVTGFDIIFFWVARMMMMGLHFMDEVPFHTVYIHALVRDEKGQKMSKSKGNVIDPLDLDRRVRRRCAALHAGRDGGAGPRHQALAKRGSRAIAISAPSCGTRRASAEMNGVPARCRFRSGRRRA